MLSVVIDPGKLPGVWVYRGAYALPDSLVGLARWTGALGAVNQNDLDGDMTDDEWRAVQAAGHRYIAEGWGKQPRTMRVEVPT